MLEKCAYCKEVKRAAWIIQPFQFGQPVFRPANLISGLWCMTVHSCFVEDGSGAQFIILNDEGRVLLCLFSKL